MASFHYLPSSWRPLLMLVTWILKFYIYVPGRGWSGYHSDLPCATVSLQMWRSIDYTCTSSGSADNLRIFTFHECFSSTRAHYKICGNRLETSYKLTCRFQTAHCALFLDGTNRKKVSHLSCIFVLSTGMLSGL